MATIRIIKPGIYTSVQDLGRFGYQQFGMPVTGAMDTYSLRLANGLVRNKNNEACLEATYTGPDFEVLSDIEFAVTGGNCTVSINDSKVPINCNHQAKTGDIIKIGTITNGCRIYISFSGGIDVPLVMNSKSTYSRAVIGGYQGRALKSGDEIILNKTKSNFRFKSIPPELLLNFNSEHNIRIIGGSEVDYFSFDGIKTFLTSTYTVSSQSDRMGYRLDGPLIKHKKAADIISSGIANGAIQVPGDGKPIIMLADRQTVGGYTKIANVISADLPLIGQLKPGDSINFTQVHLEEAHKILHTRERNLKSFLQ